jgi:hypothetical protein
MNPTRAEALAAVEAALDYAYAKHGRDPWGRHEFFGVLYEEMQKELGDAIFADEPIEHVLEEAIQVAAVCIRYLETGDRYRGPHPPLPQKVWRPGINATEP